MRASPAKPPGRRRSGTGPATLDHPAEAPVALRQIGEAVGDIPLALDDAHPPLFCRSGRPLLKQAGYAFKTGHAVQPVFRFAPSPNGELHLGHAYAALVDFELCRAAGGRFLLRIEDIDPTRCRPEYEALI